MIDVRGKLEGKERIEPRLNMVLSKLGSMARKAINESSVLLASYMKTDRFTGGTTPTRLKVRSGRLRASVKSIKAAEKEGQITGGASIGTKYARVHVGPKGQKTTIKPKRGKYLTIPLPAAQTRAGVTRGPARSTVWANTFVAKTKAGNLIIFGKKTVAKGAKAGQAKGAIVPLFLLLKSVTVPSRIDPKDVLRWIRPRVIEAFKKSGISFKETR
jgi:hypothetical protein